MQHVTSGGINILKSCHDGNLQTLKCIDDVALARDVSDAAGAGCVHYAARTGQLHVLEHLLRVTSAHGVEGALTKRTAFGSSPLHDAAIVGE